MAEVIGATSGVVALVGFGLQASKTILDTIESLKNHPKTVRDLKKEIKVLQSTLSDLGAVTSVESEAELTELQLPLYCCVIACQEFADMVRKCTINTTDSHTSMRDWTKLQLKSADLYRFRTTLSGYMSTIQIAIGATNLRTSRATKQCLEDFKITILDAKEDLREHLSQIEEQLILLANANSAKAGERQRVQQEKDSTIQCLEICEQVWSYIDRRQIETLDTFIPSDSRYSSVAGVNLAATPSGKVTARALTECRERIAGAKAELKDSANAPLTAPTNTLPTPIKDDPEVARVKKCMELCDETLRSVEHRTNLYEDISVADDSQHYIVSTIGDLICAKRVTTGSRSMVIMGQMSDESLQQSFAHLGRGESFERSSPHSSDETRRSAFTQYGKGQCVG